MSKGIFTVSLDFELHWGGVEKRTLPAYAPYFLNTRKAIPRMLELFAGYGVHATWATVGFLFHESLRDLQDNLPAHQPAYPDSTISTYAYMRHHLIGPDETEDPFHFAPSLIRAIAATDGQELGTHTFSHYYCNEPGQSLETFREDLAAAQRIAAVYQTTLRSLVFPRNQYNEAYLKECYAQGIRAVRSNPASWFWTITIPGEENMWKRINRGADAFLPLSKTSFRLDQLYAPKGVPLCIPASRFLRPYDPKIGLLNTLRLQRIKNEMTYAARQGEIYHLWWHPHNFGWYPDQSIAGLLQLLEHYAQLKIKYGMVSMNMGEVVGCRL